ncbi:uncharacterized protein LOC110714979 [Chenopodium quinoa]|uniref:Uncharacterized protein n=1 Tax=Chenopodium quinoa TaxID=63459 RepID=A0A803LZW5_CHEQI|nr:uncharacterized protein LOC110714979 [Chenopodium quinoa]
MKTEPYLASSASALLKKLEPYNPDKPNIQRSSIKKQIPTSVKKLITSLALIRCIDKIQDKNPEYYDQAELPEDLLNDVKDIVYDYNNLSDEIGIECFVKKLQQWEYFSNFTYDVLDEFEWRAQDVKKGRGTCIVTETMSLFPGLKLHYLDLPYRIRPCLVYCSMYPKGHKIVRENLINLWMAEGLLWPPSSSKEDPEDVGNRYFDELRWRGFFEEPVFAFGSTREEEEEERVIYSCEVPDNTHYFVKKIAGTEVFNVFGKQRYSSLEGLKSTRRLVLDKDGLSEEDFLKGHWNDHRVKACVLFGAKPQIKDNFLEEITWRFERLLVLDLSGTEFKELPRSTRRLKHLRYLSLSRNGIIEALPYRLYELKYLQTLALDSCHQLQELPSYASDLTRLRNLYLTSKDAILSETILSRWSSLRILELIHCKRLASLSSEGFKSLITLRKLRIFDCPRLVSLPDTMKYLTHLKELILHNCPELDLTEGEAMEELLNLRSLEIIGLPKLVRLPVGLKSASTLHYFFIARCRNLSDYSRVLTYLTSLRRFYIYDCTNLTELPEGIAVDLQMLDIRGCPELSKKLMFEGVEEWNVISHAREVIIDGQRLHKKSKHASSSSTNNTTKALNLPKCIPFFSLKLQTLGIVEDYCEDNNIQEETTLLDQQQEPRLEKCSESSIKTRAQDLFARLRDSIFTQNYKKRMLKLSEIESPTNVPPASHSSSLDQVEAKLFCSLFPKDHEFEKDTMVQLWMAEGFLKNEPLEFQGDQFFNTLLSEGCILESRVDNLTGKTKYKSNVGDESTTKIVDKMTMLDHIPKESMHMALVCDDISEKAFEKLKEFNNLKTLLFLQDYGSRIKQIPFELFLALKSLQALDLSGSYITELPSSIGNATKLQFLDLSKTLIRSLPDTIDRLENLQTLKLIECVHLFELPRGITKLTNLRHLEFDVLGQLTVMPKGVGALSALRTLSGFIIDGKEGCSNIGELKLMNNLSGSLCISGLEHVEDPEDAKKSSLGDKINLKKLELRWSDIDQDWTHKETEVLAHLEPSTSLEELQILCFPGVSFPSWVGHPSFHKLVSITLLKCKNLSLPPLGKLPQLKHLEIIEVDNVAKIDRQFCRGSSTKDDVAFPRLEKLVVDGMFILETWEGVNDGDFPNLSELSIKFCPNLSTLPMLPHLPPLKYLELSNCTSLESVPDGRCLISLETLLIEDCPLIEKKCTKGDEFRNKIQHVLDVWIDGLEEDMGLTSKEVEMRPAAIEVVHDKKLERVLYQNTSTPNLVF